MNIFSKRTPRLLLLMTLLALGALPLVGCESDPTAPQDQIPALSEADAAQQAALVAKAAAVVGPQVVTFSSKSDKDAYTHTFSGDITGTVHLDFFTGGAGGTPAAYDVADYCHLYTAAGEWLAIALGFQGTVVLTFDITADINQTANTAVVGGGGTFRSGAYSSTFSFTDLAVAATGYPSGGSLTFVGGGFTMVVSYDGSDTAIISIGGVGRYAVDLDTGDVTEIGLIG